MSQGTTWLAWPARIGLLLLAVLAGLALPSYADAQPGALPMPTLQDERNTYTAWGWAWTASDEPNFPAEPSYSVSDPDIHGDTEADDLWNYVQAYRRTGQLGYRDRMEAWARYYKDDYLQCVGTYAFTYCSDKGDFNLDHFYGWGLIDYHLLTGSQPHLTAAINLGAALEAFWNNHPSCDCKPSVGFGVIGTGPRRIGRHLLFATRLAEVTGDPRWAALRDYLVTLVMGTFEWDATYKMYFVGQFTTDAVVDCVSNPYANGARIMAPNQLAVLVEALYHVWRTTGNTTVRQRITDIASFVAQRGLHGTYQYTGSWFGVVNGQTWHSYASSSSSCSGTTSFWDPVYTTALVNTLVYGYKFTGTPSYLTAAGTFFNRGTKGVYGSSTQQAAPDNEVAHFVDSRTTTDGFYLAFNKGELQYTYRIFENGGNPTIETPAGWTQLSNTQIRSVCASPSPGGDCSMVIVAWSSAIADTLRNRLIVWGGGHNDYAGNEIYAIDLAASTVTRFTNPSTPAGSGSPDALSDGRPSSRHTYDGLAYIAHADRLFSFGGSVHPGGNCSSGTWTFSFATGTWQGMNPSGPTLGGTCGALAAYDPNTQKVFVMDRGPFNFVSYSLATNSYEYLNDYPSGISLYRTAAIDPTRRLFVIAGGGEFRVIDISPSSNYALQTWTTTGATQGISGGAPGLAYDPVSDRMIAYPGSGNTVYSLDMDTRVWTALSFSGGPAAGSPGPSGGTFGRFEYFPTLGVFATVNDVDSNAYILRLSDNPGPPPPPPTTPPSPTSLSVH